MITRYALFEGQIHAGQADAFRDAVNAEILPLWKQFPGRSRYAWALPKRGTTARPNIP